MQAGSVAPCSEARRPCLPSYNKQPEWETGFGTHQLRRSYDWQPVNLHFTVEGVLGLGDPVTHLNLFHAPIWKDRRKDVQHVFFLLLKLQRLEL